MSEPSKSNITLDLSTNTATVKVGDTTHTYQNNPAPVGSGQVRRQSFSNTQEDAPSVGSTGSGSQQQGGGSSSGSG